MGYYIQVPHNQGKAQQLVAIHGAKIIERPINFADVPKDMAIICVVDNGPFEAAGFAYDEQEFEAFKSDFGRFQRPRTWLLMDRAEVCKLTGFPGV